MAQHSIGERFGDYKLVRPLGEGGFASVYLGEEVHKGTPAAVKLLKEQQVHDFIKEVNHTFRLQHPNIVKILSFGIRELDNTAFIIMEYAPNGSFRERYPRDTRVPLEVVVPTVKQVALALQYAHDKRVIHRDVKPENLLISEQNSVLLSDFGIATTSSIVMKLNAEQDVIVGTYAYMAPEQLKGHPVPASDQYSLAVMVYEWLCGELPFEGREFIQWAYQHEKVPPTPLREHIPSLSPAVEQVVLRALAKKPEERFENVKVFALTLRQAVRGEDVSSVLNVSRSIKHTRQIASMSAAKQDNIPLPTPPKSIEQLFQEGVRAQSSGNAEEAFRIWRKILTMQGAAERYSTTVRNRIRELCPELVPLRFKLVREAHKQGHWQDEIRLWEDLLVLEPSYENHLTWGNLLVLEPSYEDYLTLPITLGSSSPYPRLESIRERLKIAQQNEKASFMYASAQRFIHENDSDAARAQLQMLWNDAPYYGDPKGLADLVGLPAASNYEQAIATEQLSLEMERIESEMQYQQKIERIRAEKARFILIITTMLIVGGVIAGAIGSSVGGGMQGVYGAMAGGAIGATIGAATLGVVSGLILGKGVERIFLGLLGLVGGLGGGMFGGIAGIFIGIIMLLEVASRGDGGGMIEVGSVGGMLAGAIGALIGLVILTGIFADVERGIINKIEPTYE